MRSSCTDPEIGSGKSVEFSRGLSGRDLLLGTGRVVELIVNLSCELFLLRRPDRLQDNVEDQVRSVFGDCPSDSVRDQTTGKAMHTPGIQPEHRLWSQLVGQTNH